MIVGHYIWLAVLYIVAGIYSKSNPFDVIRNYGPAYITAIGTMSSAATLAVALRCAKKSEPPLRDDMVDFGIPLFANIHLCGFRSDRSIFCHDSIADSLRQYAVPGNNGAVLPASRGVRHRRAGRSGRNGLWHHLV